MGEAIGDLLPAAVGVAISPLSIVAVVMMLVSTRARTNGPAFLAGWLVGVAGRRHRSSPARERRKRRRPAARRLGRLAKAGALLLLLSLRQWRGRPHADEEPVTPKWMGALDGFTPIKAAAAGVALSALNPKNLLLTVAGAAAIAQTGIGAGEQAAALLVFTLMQVKSKRTISTKAARSHGGKHRATEGWRTTGAHAPSRGRDPAWNGRSGRTKGCSEPVMPTRPTDVEGAAPQ